MNMETYSDDLDICGGAENLPIYFVCDGKRQQLNNKEVLVVDVSFDTVMEDQGDIIYFKF